MGDGMLSLSWNNHKATFCHILANLRDKERYTDVTLACEGKFYPVHKLVLSTCSEYFESMFEHTPCKHPIIVLKDVKPDELEALLSYMYAGVVNVAQNDLARLIKAAELLQIKGLAVPDEPPVENDTSKKTQVLPPPRVSRDSWDERTSPHPKRRRKDDSRTPSQGGSQPSNSPSSSPRASPYHAENDQENSRTLGGETLTMDSSSRTEKVESRTEQRIDTRPDQKVADSQHLPQGSPVQVILDETLVKEEILDPPVEESQEGLMDSGMDYGSMNADSRLQGSVGDDGQTGHMLPNKFDQPMTGQPPPLHEAVVEALAGPSGMQGWLGGTDMGGSYSSMESYGGESGHQDVRQSLPGQQPQGHQMMRSESQCQITDGRRPVGKIFAGPKTHHCSYCDYTTSVITNLKNHLRTHTGETPYSCSYCNYSTTTKQSLVYHIRTHTGEKPYACPHCSYRSKQQGTMRIHILGHQKDIYKG